jgi:hypothetical protein
MKIIPSTKKIPAHVEFTEEEEKRMRELSFLEIDKVFTMPPKKTENAFLLTYEWLKRKLEGTWFYENCKTQRRKKSKCCNSCPFREIIEKYEENRNDLLSKKQTK